MNKLLNRAMSLLARRDHSEYELRRKLAAQFSFNPAKSYQKNSFQNNSSEILTKEEINNQIESVIQYCHKYHWLDDKKFATAFIRARSAKGYGPQRIKLELQQKGIDKDIIYSVFDDCDNDWVELAEKLIIQNFVCKDLTDWKTKAKVYNYLVNKGFYPDDINKALKNSII